MNLNGQVVIVTGGGRGLGRAYALALAAAGAAQYRGGRTVAAVNLIDKQSLMSGEIESEYFAL